MSVIQPNRPHFSLRMSQRTQKMVIPYVFLVPAISLFLVFMVYPLLKGLQISFFNWSIMPNKPSVFIGLANYIKAFTQPITGIAFRNTLVYTVVTVAGQMIFAMVVAVMINGLSKGKTLYRILYYIPVITSWVIVSLLFRYLFQSPQGIINYFLVSIFHVTSQPIPWLQQSQYSHDTDHRSGHLERHRLVDDHLPGSSGNHPT